MTRQRIHELADIVMDYNDKAEKLDSHNARVHMHIDGRYNNGYVWVCTGLTTNQSVSYTYSYDKGHVFDSTDDDKNIYDPDYQMAEAHIRALMEIMEGGANA